MALVLGIAVESSADCKKLVFSEITGAYDVTNNPTGWGNGTTVADATSADLTILTPAGNSYTIDLFGDFPNDDSTVTYEIDSSMIGYGTNQKLPDGVYRFTYEVVVSVGESIITYTQVIQVLVYCNAQCCVFNMFADIDFECSCSTDKQDKAKKAYLMLKGLQYAAACGLTNYFEDLLSDLNKICKGNCTNC